MNLEAAAAQEEAAAAEIAAVAVEAGEEAGTPAKECESAGLCVDGGGSGTHPTFERSTEGACVCARQTATAGRRGHWSRRTRTRKACTRAAAGQTCTGYAHMPFPPAAAAADRILFNENGLWPLVLHAASPWADHLRTNHVHEITKGFCTRSMSF